MWPVVLGACKRGKKCTLEEQASLFPFLFSLGSNLEVTQALHPKK